MNKPTVQDIFYRFYPAYLEQYTPSYVQSKVANNIMNCKTGAYGMTYKLLYKQIQETPYAFTKIHRVQYNTINALFQFTPE